MTTQSQYTGIAEKDIKTYFEQQYGNLSFHRKGHTNRECEKRQIYFYFMAIFTRLSLSVIAKSLDERFDHTTVIYSKKKIEGLMKFDRKTKIEVEKHKAFIEENIINK